MSQQCNLVLCSKAQAGSVPKNPSIVPCLFLFCIIGYIARKKENSFKTKVGLVPVGRMNGILCLEVTVALE